MKVVLEHERAALLHGDCKDLLQVLDENSVDAIVTDPPAGIAFMGQDWDKDKGGRDAWIKWFADAIAAAYRALKPGGHGLFWALPRTSHWTATALEDAGFELRDLHHHFSECSGELYAFIGSLDADQRDALDRVLQAGNDPILYHLFGSGFPKSLTSNSAEIPKGTGTALKPAAEHWILVRKPLDGGVAANHKTHGTGVLQIDACRIGDEVRINPPAGNKPDAGGSYMMAVHGMPDDAEPTIATGRWPAHVSFDETTANILDEQSGISEEKARLVKRSGARHDGSESWRTVKQTTSVVHPGKGGASRFFYVAKPAKSETEAGLDHLPKKSGGEATGREDDSAGVKNPRAGAGRGGGRANFHPTKKSIALMRWLIRLITPPGGIVLDPFAGSGSTGVAAIAEGCSFVGCELTADYVPILVGRISHALGIAPPDAASY